MNEQEKNIDHNPIIAITICVAVFLSLVAFLYPSFAYIGTDGVSYALLAKNLATGHGFTLFGYPHAFFNPLTPIAIVPFYFIFWDIDFASHVAVITFELLTLALFYFVARRFADARVAAIATLFLSVSGPFVWETVAPLAQPLASLLTVIFIFFLLQYSSVIKSGKTPFFLAMFLGMLAGLLYLNRPEYFFLPGPLVLFLIWINQKYVSHQRNLTIVLMSVVGFLLLAVPYIIYLHHVLGEWTISGKIANLYVLAAHLSINGLLTAPPQLAENSLILIFKEIISPSFLKNYFENLYLLEWVLLRAFGIVGFAFFGMGLRYLILQWNPEKLFALLVPIPILFVLPFGFSGNAYATPYFSIFLLIIAVGCSQFVSGLTQTFTWGHKVAQTVLIVLVLASSIYFSFVIFQNYFFRSEETKKPVEYQMLGNWFRAHVPGHDQIRIVARKPEIAFYAEADWVEISGKETPDQLLEIMKAEHATYLAVDSRNMGDAMQIFVDTENKAPTKGLELVREFAYGSQQVNLYHLSQ